MKHRCHLAFALAAIWQTAAPNGCLAAPPPPPAPDATFLQQLECLSATKPVPLVAVIIGKGLNQRKPQISAAEKPWKDALQEIGAAYSEPVRGKAPKALAEEFEATREVYIPFEFDRVWTIARDLQWVVNVDPPVPDYLSGTEPGVLLSDLERSLTSQQWRTAGSPGLSLADLYPNQQEVFRAAFSRPVVLWQFLPGDAAKHEPVMKNEFDGKVDMDHARLHVYTAWRDVSVGTERSPDGEEFGMNYPLKPFEGYIRFPRSPAAADGYATPTLLTEPAHLKKGDLVLDSVALLAPIGISGESRVDKVIAAASKVSRLTLKVDPRLATYSVFVSDPKLRTGDVLRAMAFDLQGAFRKVGKTYLLTFDRIGVGSMSMALDERLAEIDQSRNRAKEVLLGLSKAASWWQDALRLLRPDPNGPPGPTPEQITTLSQRHRPTSPNPVIRFPDLTSAQQASVRSALREGAWLMRDLNVDDPKVDAAIQKASFSDVSLRVVLEVAGGGRYTVQDNPLTINPSTEQYYEDQRKGIGPDPPVKAAEGPIALKVRDRAVAVPPLRASEWPRLFGQMNRKSIDTLYLPVLWDGYTLFPSREFPLLPAANGKDLLAGVLARAKADNIKVIAVIHVLSWRFPGGAKSHWLSRHPELVSLDLIGRRRWDWMQERVDAGAGYPLFQRLPANDPLLFGDMVIPGDPRVESRIEKLLDELKTYPGVSGVAFAEWSRLTNTQVSGYSSMMNQSAPVLGYSEAEREAFLTKEGVDPVDIAVNDYQRVQIPNTRFQDPRLSTLGTKWLTSVLSADTGLLKTLVSQSEKAWPGRVSLFRPGGQLYGGDGKVYPKVDVRIRYRPEPEEALPSDAVWIAPEIPLSGIPAQDRLAEWRSQMAWADVARTALKSTALNSVLLDFRNAPDLLWDALKLLANAKAEAPRH